MFSQVNIAVIFSKPFRHVKKPQFEPENHVTLLIKRKSLMSLRQVEILDELKTKQLSILVF